LGSLKSFVKIPKVSFPEMSRARPCRNHFRCIFWELFKLFDWSRKIVKKIRFRRKKEGKEKKRRRKKKRKKSAYYGVLT